MNNQYMIVIAVLASLLAVCRTIYTQDTSSVLLSNLSISKKAYLQAVRCQGFVVAANFRKIQLHVDSDNIDHLLITDREIEDCDEEQFSECHENSNNCIHAQMTGSADYSIGKCQEEFYIYFYIRNYTGGAVLAKINETSGCDNIPQDNFTTCASIPLNECGIKNSKCNQKCFRLDCTYMDTLRKNKTSVQMCLPTNVTTTYWNNKCNQQYSYYKSSYKQAIAYYCSSDKPMTSDIYRENDSDSGWFLTFLKWVLYLAIILFVSSIIYYRWALNKSGEPPFRPPQWMPAIVYPPARVQGDPLENYRQI